MQLRCDSDRATKEVPKRGDGTVRWMEVSLEPGLALGGQGVLCSCSLTESGCEEYDIIDATARGWAPCRSKAAMTLSIPLPDAAARRVLEKNAELYKRLT